MAYFVPLHEKVFPRVMSTSMCSQAVRIRCRQIVTTDIDGLVNLLKRGFRVRTRDFWARAFRRMTEHSTPPGFPKYGYLLECNGIPVGVILLIFSYIFVKRQMRVRCSVSSWYVEPPFRAYAAMLASYATRHEHVTYFNITPDSNTLPILEAQGYKRYCAGRFVAVPILSAWSSGCDVELASPGICATEDLPAYEIELLLNHADYDCISVMCNSANQRYPFVFVRRRKAGVISFASLGYCRDLQEFVRFAGPLGRFLAGCGIHLVVLDSNGPVRGLIGRYRDGAPKYFKGPDQPRLGDTAYSERVMFGL
jgi:hypothetical protein